MAALGDVLPSVNAHRAGLSPVTVHDLGFWLLPVESGGGNDSKLLYIYRPNDVEHHGKVGNESGSNR